MLRRQKIGNIGKKRRICMKRLFFLKTGFWTPSFGLTVGVFLILLFHLMISETKRPWQPIPYTETHKVFWMRLLSIRSIMNWKIIKRFGLSVGGLSLKRSF